ncbi:MAG: glycosyltransferase family 4 protein [Patescibacteria group bacterium]
MIIGVDGNEANVERRVGVSVYALNLLRYFCKWATDTARFKVYLRTPPQADMPKENRYFKYEVVPGAFLWSQIFLPLKLYSQKDIDVFFSPAHYLPRFCPVPSVVTIHDLSYLFFPEDFLKKDLYQLKTWTRYSVNAAKAIVAVSETTKRDIVKNYGVPSSKVNVIHNGYEKKHLLSESKLRLLESDHPYILYVGTLQPRKNINTLIEAFYKFKHLYPDFKLVIAGKKGWLYEKIFDLVTDLGLEDDVYFTDYISDNQLIFLYKNAFCYVMPSLYEGFGIPPLEAMSMGCPVISSITSSLPEISGDAALYFDPKSPFDLVEKLKKLKETPELRKSLIKKGYHRIKQFSWETCASETLDVIKNLK